MVEKIHYKRHKRVNNRAQDFQDKLTPGRYIPHDYRGTSRWEQKCLSENEKVPKSFSSPGYNGKVWPSYLLTAEKFMGGYTSGEERSRELGIGSDTPWCGAFMKKVIGNDAPKDANSARSWLNYGNELNKDKPLPIGAIVIFKKEDLSDTKHGHVGICVGEQFVEETKFKDGEPVKDTNGNPVTEKVRYIAVLGGNQAGTVCVNLFRADLLLGARSPKSSDNKSELIQPQDAIIYSREQAGADFMNNALFSKPFTPAKILEKTPAATT